MARVPSYALAKALVADLGAVLGGDYDIVWCRPLSAEVREEVRVTRDVLHRWWLTWEQVFVVIRGGAMPPEAQHG